MQDDDVENGLSSTETAGSGGSLAAEDKRSKRMKRSKITKTVDVPKSSDFTQEEVRSEAVVVVSFSLVANLIPGPCLGEPLN